MPRVGAVRVTQPLVETYLKPDAYGPCECGCEVEGRLKKPSRDGKRHVQRLCKCVSCRNRQNRARGRDRQAQGVKRTKAFVGKFLPSQEESLQLPFRYEHKDGAKARTVATAYERERVQSDQAKSIGDPRIFVAGYSVSTKHTYYVIRDDDLAAFVVGLADVWGLTA